MDNAKTNNKLGNIGQLIKVTGLSRHTIHYYEKIGLIKPAKRTDSNYRLYDLQQTIKILSFIKKAQVLNFSLNEIQELIHIYEGKQKPCQRVKALLKEKLKAIDDAIQELHSKQKFLMKVNNEWEHLLINSSTYSKDDNVVCPLIDNLP